MSLGRLLLAALLSAAAGRTGATEAPAARSIVVQACWSGAPGGKVHLVTLPARRALPLQAQPGAIVANTVVPGGESFELWVADAPQARRVATFEPPSGGRRFILVLQGDHPAALRAWLVPADLETFPWGSACLLNLSDKRLRCRLGDQTTEVDPGRPGVVPFVAAERSSVHLALDWRDGTKWMPDCATKTIVSPARRFVLVVGPGLAAQGPLPKDTLVETNPAPVTGPTPLPDPPAK